MYALNTFDLALPNIIPMGISIYICKTIDAKQTLHEYLNNKRREIIIRLFPSFFGKVERIVLSYVMAKLIKNMKEKLKFVFHVYLFADTR